MTLSDTVALFVSVPVACFRAPHAREYFETLPCPPPSTVFGMLLSAVGESRRARHEGAELAIGLLSTPAYSTVLRTLWRVKDVRKPLGSGENKRPDFQELLTDVRLAVWLRPGTEPDPDHALSARVRSALLDLSTVRRFGALSLGESTHMVDEFRLLRAGDPAAVRWLSRDPNGLLSLPIWPNHVGSIGTTWGQFSMLEVQQSGPPPASAWIGIRRAA